MLVIENQLLLSEWDYEKNDELALFPEKLVVGSNKYAFWKCRECHNEWKAQIVKRGVRGQGCPVCSRKKQTKNRLKKQIEQQGSLSDNYPQIANEWDYERNSIKPTEVLGGSHEKYHWICNRCGNRWEALIYKRTIQGQGCPLCSKQTMLDRSLYKWCMDNHREYLLEEWNYELNQLTPKDYFAHSEKEVMWKCTRYKHSYPAQIAFRTKKKSTGCCYCSGKRVLKGFNDLGSLSIAEELSEKNVKRADEIVRMSHEKMIWNCSVCKNEYTARVADRVMKNSGCPYCNGRLPIKGVNDLKTWCINNDKDYLLQEWRGEVSPEYYRYASNALVEWECSICGNRYKKQIEHRTLRDYGCSKCNIGGTSFPEQFIYEVLNELAIKCTNRDKSNGFEVDIMIPDINIAIEYNGAYYHSSINSISKDRWKKEQLKKLGIRLLTICENDNISDLTEDFIVWKYSRKKEDLYDLAKQVLSWISSICGEYYEVDIDSVEMVRTQVLRKMQFRIREKNLANTYPELLSEWNYEKNAPILPENIAAGSKDYYSWKCIKCDSIWEMTPLDRINGSGCPACSKMKRIKSYRQSRVEKYNFKLWCEENNKQFLLLDWDYDNNKKCPEDYSYGTNDKVYWRHHVTGHMWYASIVNRRNSKGECQCKICAYKRRGESSSKEKLASSISLLEWCEKNDRMEILDEWDYINNKKAPEDYSRGSQQAVSWICSVCGEPFVAQIKTRTSSIKKIGVCRHRKKN